MRCLLTTLEYPPFRGGVSHYYHNLVKNWPTDDKLVVLDNNQQQLQATTGFWPWRRAFAAIWQMVRRHQIDLVLVGQVLPLGTVVWLLSYCLPFKYGVFFHGMDWSLAISRSRKRWLTRQIINRSQIIIAANSYVAGLIKQFSPNLADRLIVINPCLDNLVIEPVNKQRLASLRQQYDLADKSILLTVGRVVERKGIDKVLASLPELLIRHPELHYVVVGTGSYLDHCRQLASQLGINTAVTFVPDADDEERSAWYQLADIFIMPARQIGNDFEGFGIVYLEANQAGKPVIAGQSGGVGDAVVNDLNGLLINPESEAEIIMVVDQLLAQPDLRARLGRGGQERLVNFLWPYQAAKLADFINQKK